MVERIIASPQAVIAEQVVTYNNRDLDGYMALFHADVEIYDHPGVMTLQGVAAVKARYAALFRDKPLNKAEIIHRIVIGARVIDHEVIYRDGKSHEGFEMVAIYEVEDGLIKRIDFIRNPV